MTSFIMFDILMLENICY